MDIALFIFILFLIVLVIFILPILVGYKLWNKGKYTKYFVGAALAGYFYMWFHAYYPNDAFFIAHLEQFTGVKFEQGINVMEKSAGYPDMHGDYPACAVMKLTDANIAKLKSVNVDNYEEINPNKVPVSCLESNSLQLERLFYKEAPGELIYWGYNLKTREVYFDYYSH
jgi:hypothetical protein